MKTEQCGKGIKLISRHTLKLSQYESQTVYYIKLQILKIRNDKSLNGKKPKTSLPFLDPLWKFKINSVMKYFYLLNILESWNQEKETQTAYNL